MLVTIQNKLSEEKKTLFPSSFDTVYKKNPFSKTIRT